ncbi:DUF2156 domain-containing protein [Dendrosporobacter sp. 1207_IL3150]|uniref:DUF2156 domain-containing protein n=1 Tax=Dendrosporobacter sp. 1207_IL3150 TaxID=3084054 RepID=UPI002FDAFB15
MNFRKIELDNKPIFDEFFQKNYYENAHLNFTNLFMWRNVYQIEWTVEEEFLYIRAAWGTHNFALQPIGPDDLLDNAIGKWQQYFKETGNPFTLRGVEARVANLIEQLMPGEFTFTSDRDNYDYVYRAQDLIELKGRSYHSKKNHVNSFRKNHSDAEYLPLTSDLIEQCIANTNEWCKKRGCSKDPMLLAEKNAIVEVFSNFDVLKLVGGVVLVDKKVEAFSFGERLNKDTAVIHVEKANPDIKGIYAAINQEFCKHSWGSMEYINREEDMGIPGLRKAKQSYHPVKMIEKYTVTLSEQ